LQTYNPLLKEKLYGLDHLRALAITLVFFFHYPNPSSEDFPEWILNLKDFGWIGVDLFFVLSGFLIATQLFEEIAKQNKINFKAFYIKRLFRIIPVYLVVVAIYFLVPAFREREELSALWKYLTFTQNIGLNPSINGTFSHAWSLCVEEQFYLLFPLVLLLLIYTKTFKKSIFIFIAIIIAAMLLRYFIWIENMPPLIKADEGYSNFWVTWIYYPTYTRLDGLLTGIGIAGLITFRPNLSKKIMKQGNLLFMLGCVLLVSCYFICKTRWSFNANVYGFALVSIAFGFIVFSAISPSCFLYKFKSKITTSIAILSYSIYLTHKGIRHLCHENFSKLGIDEESGLMLILTSICCMIAALILRYTIEKPFLKIRDRAILRLK
jgi:peptidoglycan/LPS O-acetylase OafA/YrhL